MEVFSLLKLTTSSDNPITPTSALFFSSDRNHDGGRGSDDEGPFFDLDFAVPLQPNDLQELKMNASCIGHRLSSSSTSLPDEILFSGRLFTLESSSSSSLFFSPSASETNSKPQFPASVLKSATKLRVFMSPSTSKTRPNSAATPIKFIKEERRLCKDVILRYIKKIKPLYVKVSKLRFSGPLGSNKDGLAAAHVAGAKKQTKEKLSSTGSSLPYKLKVVPVRLRKSRSASSAVAFMFSPPVLTSRRDDSLLQQEDGIQGAIAHCKRSFHSEKGVWATESPLLRSLSDPGGERSIVHGRGKGIHGDESTVC